MYDAGAYCYHRSQLIGKYLEEHGIESEQLYINCPGENIFATDPRTGAFKAYGDHWVNVVKVGNNQIVFDPQFKTKPMPLKDYVRSIVEPYYTIKEQSTLETQKHECTYRTVDRRSYQEVRDQINKYNEKLKIKFGTVGEYGEEKELSPKIEKQLNNALMKPLDWFDPRIKWYESALTRFEKQIQEWNEIISTNKISITKNVNSNTIIQNEKEYLNNVLNDVTNGDYKKMTEMMKSSPVSISGSSWFRTQAEKDKTIHNREQMTLDDISLVKARIKALSENPDQSN